MAKLTAITTTTITLATTNSQSIKYGGMATIAKNLLCKKNQKKKRMNNNQNLNEAAAFTLFCCIMKNKFYFMTKVG